MALQVRAARPIIFGVPVTFEVFYSRTVYHPLIIYKQIS